jgi:adenylate kinase
MSSLITITAETLTSASAVDTLLRLLVSLGLLASTNSKILSTSDPNTKLLREFLNDIVNKGATSRQMIHLSKSPGALRDLLEATSNNMKDLKSFIKILLNFLFWPAEHMLLASSFTPKSILGLDTLTWVKRSATLMVGYHALSVYDNYVRGDHVLAMTSYLELCIALSRSQLYQVFDPFKIGVAGTIICSVYLSRMYDVNKKKLLSKLIVPSNNKQQPNPVVTTTTNTKSKGIILAGAPGSGKGTQAQFIVNKYKLIHLSTGDMLRAAVKAGTEIGTQAKLLMDNGQLVPDQIMIQIIHERLNKTDVIQHGFLLDGFPRTSAQANALKELGVDISSFIHLDCQDQTIIERIVGRRQDPVTGNIYHLKFKPPPENDVEILKRLIQRDDDTEKTIVKRLEAFHKHIHDVVKEFSPSQYVKINGEQSPEQVWEKIDLILRDKF